MFLMLAISIPTAFGEVSSREDRSAPTSVSYVVSPHPDDEFQGWSLVEDSPANYKIFIVLTEGEETGFCTPDTYVEIGYDEPFERPADPVPTGRWTQSCSTARLTSWVRYFKGMSATDPTLPGALTDLGERGPFAATGTTVCRRDRGNDDTCDAFDRTARVWRDSQGRGALVAFNLGDGDLTTDEVVWAVQTVRDNRGALGLNSTLPEHNIIGATFSNRTYPNCVVYDHADHYSVHSALYNHDFGVNYQAGATCRSDPDADRFETVTPSSVDAAFDMNGNYRVGAHNNNYGWLHSGSYPVDRDGQGSLFHSEQSFWTRY